MASAQAPMRPRLSVVIPTFRRVPLLTRCLRAVLDQDIDDGSFEVIVVDDGHDEATRACVAALAAQRPRRAPLHYIRPPRGRGPAVARNAGWRAARGEIVAFTDDDTVPERDWLAQGERAMRGEPVPAAVAGAVRVPMPRRVTDHARMTEGLARAEFVTANAFVRRSALQKVGGFDERFARAWREDSDLQFRLMDEAGPVLRCPQAVVTHPVREVGWGVSLGQQRNTFFDALLYKKHPLRYRQRIRRVPPWHYYLVVLAAVAAPLLAWRGQRTLAAAAGALALLLVIGMAVRRLAGTSRAPSHVLEMLATSALIPFLSVYWRLRGALHFRTFFL
ncbi:glycosyltransferase family A protein [Rhizobacter sp. SG703]|uniref:glycosyltransferase family 2 protein n=1 Tax=Rhizobacter sp. SG703 TaxID=2587140 RepID=UPI0017C93017|nr:glycosyltransferase family A protein [Rhizobacter sp. SG703]NKI92515.1 glycosyltransferase involved in cell wall biosynthesis [Rhizobacter sp. SG703]